MKNPYSLFSQCATLNDAIDNGLVPFSLIITLIDFMEHQSTHKADINYLKQELVNGNYTFDENKNTIFNVPKPLALIEYIDFLSNEFEDVIVTKARLIKNGVQVEVSLYKASGKYAYGGQVNLGIMNVFSSNILNIIENKQDIITSKNFDGYMVVVNDTAINHNDINYALTMNRTYSRLPLGGSI